MERPAIGLAPASKAWFLHILQAVPRGVFFLKFVPKSRAEGLDEAPIFIRVPMTAYVKVFGCRPFTGVYRRAEAGPAFENLQGRKPRVGRAAIRRRELWGFERRRRVLAGRWKEGQSRFRRMARCAGAFSVGDGIGFFAADVVMIGARSIFGRAPSAPSSDPRR